MTQTRASITQQRTETLATLDRTVMQLERQMTDLHGVLAALDAARTAAINAKTALNIWATSDEEPMILTEHQAKRSLKDLADKMAGNGT